MNIIKVQSKVVLATAKLWSAARQRRFRGQSRTLFFAPGRFDFTKTKRDAARFWSRFYKTNPIWNFAEIAPSGSCTVFYVTKKQRSKEADYKNKPILGNFPKGKSCQKNGVRNMKMADLNKFLGRLWRLDFALNGGAGRLIFLTRIFLTSSLFQSNLNQTSIKPQSSLIQANPT